MPHNGCVAVWLHQWLPSRQSDGSLLARSHAIHAERGRHQLQLCTMEVHPAIGLTLSQLVSPLTRYGSMQQRDRVPTMYPI